MRNVIGRLLGSRLLTLLPQISHPQQASDQIGQESFRHISLRLQNGNPIPLELLMLYRHIKSLDLIFHDFFLLRSLNRLVPPSIGMFSSLEQIDLRQNHLTSIPAEIGHLSNLKNLFLCVNRLQCLPKEITLLTSLEILWANTNLLRTLPEDIGRLTSLKKLSLNSNELLSLPDELSLLINLQDLSLSINLLNEMPKQITSLSRMEKLDLSHNKIKHISLEMSALSSLQILLLGFNQLQNLPDHISDCLPLECLDLSHNKLSSLHLSSFSSLRHLKKLDISRNSSLHTQCSIDTLPSQFSYPLSLEDPFRLCYFIDDSQFTLCRDLPCPQNRLSISISHSDPPNPNWMQELLNLPQTIQRLFLKRMIRPENFMEGFQQLLLNLSDLLLTHSNVQDFLLSNLSLFLGHFNLKTLYFVSCSLTFIPFTSLQPLFPNLESFHLIRNQSFSVFPAEITCFSTSLRHLSFISCNLSSLSPEIGLLTNLETLDLSSNKLTSLPPEIGSLSNLETLDLSSNKLTSLPPEIGSLSNLRKLAVVENYLASFPEEICLLTSLTSLEYDDFKFNSSSKLPILRSL